MRWNISYLEQKIVKIKFCVAEIKDKLNEKMTYAYIFSMAFVLPCPVLNCINAKNCEKPEWLDKVIQ